VQVVQQTGRKVTRRFMAHPKVSLVLATGGPGLVQAAYSAGKPAIAVGPGNTPVLIAADADLDRAARSIVASKAFDNGLGCGAEHNLVADACVVAPFLGLLERHGAAVLTPGEERDFFAECVEGKCGDLRRDLVGQSAELIARTVGIQRPYPIGLLVIPAAARVEGPYAGEKLAPVVSLFTVRSEDEGLMLCRALLDAGGPGQTAVVHSTSATLVERFACAMRASRILVNAPAAACWRGTRTGIEDLSRCGVADGNGGIDNATWRRMVHITRVAHGVA
jgi:acyl-CoA reductase-like NAD-dependent aldehyde dehydrogenase